MSSKLSSLLKGHQKQLKNDDLDDRQYYESISLETLGIEGFCKMFCDEYRRLIPRAELWAVKRVNGSIEHVFIVIGERAFDIRGGRTISQMKTETSNSISAISQQEFDAYCTFGDTDSHRDIVCRRFREALEKNPGKYGLTLYP